MFSQKTVIVDLGASRIALGRFSLNKGRLRLDELAVETLGGHPEGEADWLVQTRATLALLRTRTAIGGPVVLVLPPHLSLTKLIKTPRVKPAKRAKIIRFEAEQSIPYAPADVVWDTVVAADHEQELEMLLAAAKREPIEALCAVLQASGFEPRLVLPSSLATLAAFRLVQGVSTEPMLVLNFGARSTTLTQVAAQRFVVRTLALGTRNIMWKTAEQQDHVALEIIVARLAQEITRSMLHFRRQGGPENPVRICLTGGGACLSGLSEALAAKIKVPVEPLDLSGSIEIAGSVTPTGLAGHDLMLVDLAGAAATQLRPGQPVLNLLPPALRQRAGRRRRLWLATAALAAAAAVWPLVSYLRPVDPPARRAAAIRHEAMPPLAEAAVAPVSEAEIDEERTFDLELLDVKTAPFPLQLVGYFGEPGDYLLAFVSADQPETLLARRGHRFERFGLTLRSFKVMKIAVAHDDAWPVYETAGFAVLQDDKTGADVVLDSRRQPTVMLQAVLRGTADGQECTRQEGELIVKRGASYRIQRVQVDPPEVAIVRQAEGPGMPETRILQPVRPVNDPDERPAERETVSIPNGL